MQDRIEMWKTLRRTLTLTVFLCAAYFIVVRPLERTFSATRLSIEQRLQQALSAITQTSTHIIEGRAEITDTANIAELTLLEMRMSATRSFEESKEFSGFIPLGTKKLIIRGHYKVKGGYRLKDGVSLSMENGKPVANFPKPEVLSVELLDFDILNEDSGWMNKIETEDRAKILRELRQQMQQEAEKSGLLTTIENTLQTRLHDLLGVQTTPTPPTLP
jgi:Protein of unknown function (DUF4230)